MGIVAQWVACLSSVILIVLTGSRKGFKRDFTIELTSFKRRLWEIDLNVKQASS